MVMLIPLMALSLGALFSGYIFKDLFIGLSSKFWQDSIFFLNLKDEHTVPLWFLLTTPILVTTAIPVSYFYFIKKPEILVSFKKQITLYIISYLTNGILMSYMKA